MPQEAMAAARRITVLTGAGVSTESGIPDFRGPHGSLSGVTEAGRSYTPDEYLNDHGVRRRVWRARLHHPMWVAEPNPAHRALVELQRGGRLRALLTQNVDGLHQRAGTRRVVELHGSLLRTACTDCGSPGDMREALERVRDGEDDPDCPACGGVLRATTVAFGQPLDPDVLRAARAAVVDCDLLLVAGTSLVVSPASDLVPLAARAGAAVLICNGEPTPCDPLASALDRRPVGVSLPELVAVPVTGEGPVRTWGDPSTW
ncbi:Sir2 family NAD-dependent protein deacetylase [Actinosynnema pretiosum subsp. pretiosum]|nr:Sir2 family NAD-dependent protein deacetylase [Actinosynnema mirum]QUF06228.1 Sir2 family NAD-dependent protein deacetylase [Actinosynnema pretiosum subsp. pretiosum]